jgi:hypothetical protein
MTSILKLNIDPSLQPTQPDNVANSQLTIEVGPAKVMRPGSQTMVKLTIKNFSSVGKMTKISPTFDGSKVSVDIPANIVYVAPQGTTAVYAIVRSYAYVGTMFVHFNLS